MIAVVLFHAGHLAGGYLGVDLFFVLSGFLITSLLLTEARTSGTIQLGRFWARRARRLLPALALMLTAVGIYAILIDDASLSTLRGDAFATIGYVANWRAVFTSHDYWALFRSASPLDHTWSLAIEEQFYLVWPLVLLGLASIRRIPLDGLVLRFALVGAGTSYALMAVLSNGSDITRSYYGTDTRAGAIMLGAALAAAGAKRADRAPPAGLSVIAWPAVLALGVAWSRLAGDDPLLTHGGFLLCGLAAAVVIATAVWLPEHRIARVLAFGPLRRLGIISYGVYLWHWPIDVALTPSRVGLDGWSLDIVRIGVTLIIATASYRYVEAPIRYGWGTRRTWRWATPVIAGLLLAILLVGTAGAASPELPSAFATATAPTARSEKEAMALQTLAVDRAVGRDTPRVLLAGDSIAFSLGAGANRGGSIGVISVSMLGCGIARGTPVGARLYSPEGVCRTWPQVWTRAVGMVRPQAIVLLASTWDTLARHSTDGDIPRFSRDLARNLQGGLHRASSIAADAGIPLILLTLPCLHPPGTTSTDTLAGAEDAQGRRWINAVYRNFAGATPGVELIDLAARICPRPGAYPLTDGVHFSEQGAERLWIWMRPRLAKALERARVSGP